MTTAKNNAPADARPAHVNKGADGLTATPISPKRDESSDSECPSGAHRDRSVDPPFSERSVTRSRSKHVDEASHPTAALPIAREGKNSIRVLMGYARPQRRALIVSAALTLAAAGATLIIPLLVKRILDKVQSGAGISAPLLLLTVIIAANALLTVGEWILLARSAERVVYDARASVMSLCLRAAMPDLQRRSSGDLVTAAISDTVLLREATSSAPVSLFSAAVLSFGTLSLMAYLDLGLFFTMLATLVVLALVQKILMPRIGAAQMHVQQALGELAEKLHSYIRAIRTIKASCSEEKLLASLAHEARIAQHHATAAMRVRAIATTTVDFGTSLSVIAILAVGTLRVAKGQMDLSTLVAFLLYTFAIVGPLSEISNQLSTIQSGFAASQRMSQIKQMRLEGDLAQPIDLSPASTTTAAFGSAAGTTHAHDAILAVESVSFRYSGATQLALDNISLEIPRAGHIAIVGPSGAGKSTLLSLMLRFLEADTGSITLLGQPFGELTHGMIRSHFAFVEQGAPIISGTIRENLVLRFEDASDDEMWSALDRVRLRGVVDDLPSGLSTRLDGGILSIGQQQRIALARALIKPADILILDEATSQVDSVTAAVIHECLQEISKSSAVISVAHRLSGVQGVDKIFMLDSGRLRAVGTHEQLLGSDSLYRDMVLAAQVSVGSTVSTQPNCSCGASGRLNTVDSVLMLSVSTHQIERDR
jgi:ABC-type multidrug transport system fused ATPase/permease subunit